jgi:hypothetical protein
LDSGSSGGRVGLYKDTGGFFKEIVELNFQRMVAAFKRIYGKVFRMDFWIQVFLWKIGFGFSVGFGLLAESKFNIYTLES